MAGSGKNGMTGHPLRGRRLYIPRMSTGGAEAMAAAFRSLGVDARVSPKSDQQTLTLASRFTTGEECLPQRVVLGDFLKVIQEPDFQPEKAAFFLPTSAGPCRFGQYRNLLDKVLKELRAEEALIFSPTSSDGYEGIAANTIRFKRTAWRAVVVSDALRKMLLLFRPYERETGAADRIHDACLKNAGSVLSDGSLSLRRQRRELLRILAEARESFGSIPLKEPLGSRPLIGVVGEIFLRLNSFSNQQTLRLIEALGGETWIADISEWVWYTNAEERRKLQEAGKSRSLAMLQAGIRHAVQRADEHSLLSPFADVFRDRPEASVPALLEYSRPYLPAEKALGEMTLNAGKVIDFYHAGCDGVADLSPFTCMNSIVSEVAYPNISRDHDHFPIRIFYFDGVPFDIEGDLEIFMEQVRAYQRRRNFKPFSQGNT